MKPAHDPWHDHERTHAVHTDVRQLALGPGCYLRVRQVCGCGLCQQCSASAVACHSHFGGGRYFIVAPRGNEHLCEATNTSREATNTSVVAEENTLKAIYT